MVDNFSTFLIELEIYCQDRFKNESLQTNSIFLLKEYNIFLEQII